MSRVTRRLNDGWLFRRGEVPDGACGDCDTSAWREVSVPHDYSIEDLPDQGEVDGVIHSGPFSSEAEGGGAVGYTVGGVGWYRRRITVPAEAAGRQFLLLFDGVYMNCEVWLNGVRLGTHPYGYTAFSFDVTPYLHPGEDNLLAVRVDSSGRTSRWYCGSGIYRHVWLIETAPVHVPLWGVFVTTPEVSHEQATVAVQTRVCGASAGAEVTVTSRVTGPESAGQTSDTRAPAGDGSADFEQTVTVGSPALWSPDSPTLYRLQTIVSVAGEIVDEVETEFGLRSLEISAERGLLLNGEPLELHGGCVHHDNGPLGACTYDRAEQRRVELLKAAGFNAIRTAHNPPSPAFLSACDRLGMLVIDEAFDCWQQGKNPCDYHRYFDEWWQRDLAAMVLRDRNHPCVALWSIGNEVVEQGDCAGQRLGLALAATVRHLDPTRGVAIGAHPGTTPWEGLDTLLSCLDVCGYNYKWERYASDHLRAPARVIAGTESFPMKTYETLMATADLPHVVGDFVWTSFDYLGESGLGYTRYEGEEPQYAKWPWTAANCGDLDLCGFRRPQSYYRETLWRRNGDPAIACFVHAPAPEGKANETVEGWGWLNEWPSWSWPGAEGRPLLVRVYSCYPRVRLRLNGADLGVRDTNRARRFTAAWEVPYEAGELVAEGLDAAGNVAGSTVLRTAGSRAAVRLTPDRTALAADGQDLSFVTVEVVDAAGALDPNADALVEFAVDGPATLVAVGSSDPRSVESFQQPRRRAWRGRCLAILRAGTAGGTVRLRATSAGLEAAEATIEVG